MTRRTRIAAALGFLAVLGAIYIGCEWRGIRKMLRGTYHDDAEAVLSRQITGYLPSEWEAGGSLMVRYVEFFGVYVNEFHWSKAGSQYRHYQSCPGQEPPEWSAPMAVSVEGETALRNALNIAVRDHLWKQKDIENTTQVMDGGAMTCGFSFGPHQGQFTLTNVSFPEAPHLKEFILNVGRWTNLVRSQAESLPRS